MIIAGLLRDMPRPKGKKDSYQRTRRPVTQADVDKKEGRQDFDKVKSAKVVLTLSEAENHVAELVENAQGFYEKNESLKTYMKFADLKLRIYQTEFRDELLPRKLEENAEKIEESLDELDEESLADLIAAMKNQDNPELN